MNDFLLQLSEVTDPLQISSLNLSSKQISSFSALKRFEKLVDLDISKLQIITLPSELLNLDSLSSLKCTYNPLKETWPLPLNLLILDLSNNDLSRLSFGRMPWLETLIISNNRIIDISALSQLPSLKYCYASSNCIESLHSLSSLSIIELDISENNLKSSESLRPIMHSICAVFIFGNPFYKPRFPVPPIFNEFKSNGKGLFFRNVENMQKSSLIQKKNKNNNKEEEWRRAKRELEEVKEFNNILFQKVKDLEKICVENPNASRKEIEELKERQREIENMAYEDWRSGLERYNNARYEMKNELKTVKTIMPYEMISKLEIMNTSAEYYLRGQEFLNSRFKNILNSLQ
ncbi:unnamed protein product [Blepharisma stoltei]|uniref:Uncharacterized protein n=1 Tax=Blepharisma stoltei TaxID=1481888 RepID=A0AAU9KQ94_9CILI|nr:unnamed protein product [Blepharisma stoltei]